MYGVEISKRNKETRILRADKGNHTVVLSESIYKEISSLLESGVYGILHNDFTSQIEWKIRKLLTKHITVVPAALKYKLTPYRSKPPHLYGLPKIHKPDILLRPIVSSIDSPCYAVAEFLHKILSPLAGNTSSFVKDSEHFIKSIQKISLQNGDYLISFDVVCEFAIVLVEEALQVIRNRLSADPSLPERSEADDVMELLDICLTTTFFQFQDKFYKQKEGRAIRNSLSPMVSTYLWNTSRKEHWIQQNTNLLNGSDKSTTLSWFGRMDIDLPSNSQ
jgi:hypothetical protein